MTRTYRPETIALYGQLCETKQLLDAWFDSAQPTLSPFSAGRIADLCKLAIEEALALREALLEEVTKR